MRRRDICRRCRRHWQTATCNFTDAEQCRVKKIDIFNIFEFLENSITLFWTLGGIVLNWVWNAEICLIYSLSECVCVCLDYACCYHGYWRCCFRLIQLLFVFDVLLLGFLSNLCYQRLLMPWIHIFTTRIQ